MKKLLILSALVISACATAPKDEPPVMKAPPPSTSVVNPQGDLEENIDIEGLQRSLGLSSRAPQELGYQEAVFTTCSAGYGYSASKNCRRQTMAVINARLQCRDSEGTISTALGADDLVAIAGQGVRWTMQKRDGLATTDGQGYVTIRGIFSRSPKNDWLRLAVGLQFLNMRASQVSRVVTPRPWCHAD